MLENRFFVIRDESLWDELKKKSFGNQLIIKDRITNILYLYLQNRNGEPALTPILDIDGKPFIDKS
ncbi:MAG: DUF6440 family protein [Turicibacter sp.]|nr:DUF6440 family protein [Turicibacter sp.]